MLKLKIHHILSNNTKNFIIFIGGVITSAVVSGLLGNTILLSEGFLIFLIVLLVITAVYFFNEENQRIQKLAENMEINAYFIEELYREDEGIHYKGLIFNELNKLVSEAKMEIISVSASSENGDLTTNHLSRLEYFNTLEEIVKKNKDHKFKYLRIQQTHVLDNKSLASCFGIETANHCRRILELEKQIHNESPNNDLTISLMTVTTNFPASFMILDEKYLSLEVIAMHKDKPYTAGMLFLEDNKGSFIESFQKYSEYLEKRSQPIKLEDLKTKRN